MVDFTSEIWFKTQRSSGAGGQNVNKVETSVTALWNVMESQFFTLEKRFRIAEKLQNRINSDGILQVNSSEHRTQLANKKEATEKLLQLVEKALFVPKVRKSTKPTRASKEKRLEQKKNHSVKKENRRFKY